MPPDFSFSVVLSALALALVLALALAACHGVVIIFSIMIVFGQLGLSAFPFGTLR
jgi:hypothetical protein